LHALDSVGTCMLSDIVKRRSIRAPCAAVKLRLARYSIQGSEVGVQ